MKDWTDFDWALFLLDQAEQSLMDDFKAGGGDSALRLLHKYSDRLRQLRRDYVKEYIEHGQPTYE